MEKIKKIFSPGHEKDDEVLYNDANASKASSGASHLPTATGAADHATKVTSAHPGKENDLRRQAMTNEPTDTSRPTAPGVSSDASIASIRSGVVGGESSPSTNIGSSGQQTSLPDRTATDSQRSFPLSSDNTTSGTNHSHHGTEAALAGGAGAAGVGAYEANKHHNEGASTSSTGQQYTPFDPTSHEHKGRGHGYTGDPCPPGDEPQIHGIPHHVRGPHQTDMANRLDPHVPGEFPGDDGEDRHGHHLGRDAAVAGGAGTAGLAAHEAGRRHEPSTTSAVQPTGSETLPGSSASQSKDHHYGRDAGLAGAAGAAGVGAYETHEHDNQRSVPSGSDNAVDRSAIVSPSTTDRSFPVGNTSTNTTSAQPSKDHHLGRDAALAGGAGAAGLGAYEAGSHHHDNDALSQAPRRFDDQRYDPSATHSDRPTHIPNLTYGSSTAQTGQQPEQQHHYGRDAAVAGGVGAAGVGASQVGKHRAGSKEEDPASYTTGPHKSNIANIVDPRVQPEPEKMKTRETAGPHKSDALNRADPRVDSDLSKQQNKDHHYGRDAALAGGAGAAGYGAYEYGQHQSGPTETGPASKTLGPHSSNAANIVDPRVQPEPEKMRGNTTSAAYGSNTANTTEPGYGSTTRQDPQHHYGRDAAVAGGAGAAGVGAYEYGKNRGEPTATTSTSSTAGPYQSDSLNRADPRVDSDLSKQKEHHYGRDAALAGGAGTAGVGAYEYGKHHNEPTTTGSSSRTAGPYQSDTLNRADPRVDSDLSKQKEHHYGRDAALAGGAGTAGVGAYEYGKHHNEPTATDSTSRTAGPHQNDTLNRADPRVDSDLSQQKQHHYGRDAAVAGGAGAAGYGAYEAIDHKQQEKLEKERLKEAEKDQKHQQKELEKEQKSAQKAHDKEVAKEEKAAQKAHDHDQKKAAAAAAAAHEKEEKHHQKELDHEEKERRKAAEKAEKEREKEAEKGEKKHGLFGFLHHDKSKDPAEEQELREQNNLREADQLAHERHQRELEEAAAAGTVSTAGAKFEPSLEEQRANPTASAPQYISIDDKGHQQVSTGQDGRHRLHKEPPASVKKSLEENRE